MHSKNLPTCLIAILGLSAILPISDSRAQVKKYATLGYRSCGTGQGNCHRMDGDWWQTDPHFSTVSDLKRKKKKAMEMAQAYGIPASDYLKGTSVCAQCHGEVVTGREQRNMNTGVSCESCHGPAGPKGAGYFEIHQEGTNPKDPLDTGRSGYRKALQVGLLELRDVNVRAKTCVECHQINEKRLLEAGHPSGEGFDYVKGIRNDISRHWDYQLRTVDTEEQPYLNAVRKKPVPQFASVSAAPVASPRVADRAPARVAKPGGADRVATSSAKSPDRRAKDRAAKPAPRRRADRIKSPAKRPVRRPIATPAPKPVIIRADPELPEWLNPKSTVTIKPFDPQLSESAPVDSILLEIKKYIEYVHRTINKK